MPKEKKLKPIPEFDSQRETRVLLEHISSDVKTVSEQHGSIMEKLQEHDKRFGKIDKKLEQHDLQLLQINQKLVSHDTEFTNIEGRLGRIEKVITPVMSDHETRIKKIEEKVAPL
jgi:chromosome segregation ATPase